MIAHLLGDDYIEGLAEDCSNCIASALELLRSCVDPSIYAEHNIFNVFH